jgi:glycosyltransferase involved in cell wall biosynthesis
MAQSLHAEVLVWHVGRTSFLVPRYLPTVPKDVPPIIGIWTSPIYRPGELLRLGCGALCRTLRLSGAHLLGLLERTRCIRGALEAGWLSGLVLECEHTRARLVALGVAKQHTQVVKPSIDPLWFQAHLDPDGRRAVRRTMGFGDDDIVVGTLGPAEPLRGLPDLLSALARARAEWPCLRLLAFCRQQGSDRAGCRVSASTYSAASDEEWARFVSGWTEPNRLACSLAACDMIVLPFRLVPSDVPLSPLETMALGKPLIVTDVGCLPELVPRGTGVVVPPAAPRALAEAIQLLARSNGLREHLGKAARAHAIGWQADPGEVKWEQLLEQVSEGASSAWPARTGRARAPRHVY